MTEIIVFQMGKVASTAICEGLSKSGFQAEQSHFLAENVLVEMTKRLLNPALNDFAIRHNEGQLIANTRLLRRVNWFKKNAAMTGKRLKVITLCRDPIDWYRSEFIQNFNGYYPEIAAWLQLHPKLKTEATQIAQLTQFFQLAFDIAAGLSIPIIDPTYGQKLHQSIAKAGFSQGGTLARHLVRFAAPLRWFPDHFEPVFNINPLAYDLSDENPTVYMDTEFAEILLIRYENIAQTLATIAHFVGLDQFSMPLKNSSKDKNSNDIVNKVFEHIIPKNFIEQVYANPYCQQFGYASPINNPVLPPTITQPPSFVFEKDQPSLAIKDCGKFLFYGFTDLPLLKKPVLSSLPRFSTTIKNCFVSSGVFNPPDNPKALLGALYENGQLILDASNRGSTSKPSIDPINISEDRVSNATSIPGTCVYMGWLSSYFGHLLLEAPARFWFLNSINVAQSRFIFHPLDHNNASVGNIFQNELAQVLFHCFGIRKEQIIIANQDLLVDEVLIPSSLFFLNLTVDPTQLTIYEQIKTYILQDAEPYGIDKNLPKPKKRLYLSRRLLNKAARKASNEDVIERLFLAYGFEIIFPEKLSLQTQISLLSQANIIAGCDGSALHMGVFMPPSSKMIVLSARGIILSQLLMSALGDIETHFINAVKDQTELMMTGAWEADIPFIKEHLNTVIGN